MIQEVQKYELVNLDLDIPVFMRLHTRGKTINPKVINHHWHRSLEFNVIWDDYLLYYINGRELRLDENSVCLINSMDIHRFEPQSENTNADIIGFTLIIGYDFLKSLVADIEDSFFILDVAEKVEAVRVKILEIANIYYEQSSSYWKVQIMEKVCGLIYYLCLHCKYNRNIMPHEFQENVDKIRAIIEYIQKNYVQNLTLQEIAKEFYFSREHLSRLFKRYTSCTLKEYLTQYRLIQSEKLLINTNKSILDIAMAVGFNDVKRFIHAFKQYYRVTPLQFRKINGKKVQK